MVVLNNDKSISPPGGLEPPTFRLTAERASRLRHGGLDVLIVNKIVNKEQNLGFLSFLMH